MLGRIDGVGAIFQLLSLSILICGHLDFKQKNTVSRDEEIDLPLTYKFPNHNRKCVVFWQTHCSARQSNCFNISNTSQAVYFLKAHDVSYQNSDKNTNTKTETNKVLKNTVTKTNTKINTKTTGV